MRYILSAIALLCLSCASVAQDGTSIQTAVRIDANNSTEGIRAEYAWLAQRHPGFKRGEQSLLDHDPKYYDKIEIVTANGEQKVYYFDITSFFGKW
jgi:hypothetical protein